MKTKRNVLKKMAMPMALALVIGGLPLSSNNVGALSVQAATTAPANGYVDIGNPNDTIGRPPLYWVNYDQSGTLWAVGDGGSALYKYVNNTWQSVGLPSGMMPGSPNYGNLNSVPQFDSSGNVYVLGTPTNGTGKSWNLYLYNVTSGTWTNLGKASTIDPQHNSCVKDPTTGNLWMSFGYSIVMYNPTTNTFTKENGPVTSAPVQLAADPSGNIWANYGNQFPVYEYTNGSWVSRGGTGSPLKFIYADNNGNVYRYFSSYTKIDEYDPNTQSWVNIIDLSPIFGMNSTVCGLGTAPSGDLVFVDSNEKVYDYTPAYNQVVQSLGANQPSSNPNNISVSQTGNIAFGTEKIGSYTAADIWQGTLNF